MQHKITIQRDLESLISLKVLLIYYNQQLFTVMQTNLGIFIKLNMFTDELDIQIQNIDISLFIKPCGERQKKHQKKQHI
ncbi:hypothetical protein pb186bvf_017081 [Paramecium bursaria]